MVMDVWKLNISTFEDTAVHTAPLGGVKGCSPNFHSIWILIRIIGIVILNQRNHCLVVGLVKIILGGMIAEIQLIVAQQPQRQQPKRGLEVTD